MERVNDPNVETAFGVTPNTNPHGHNPEKCSMCKLEKELLDEPTEEDCGIDHYDC